MYTFVLVLKFAFEFMWCHKPAFQIILDWFEHKEHPDDGSDIEKKFLFLVLLIQLDHKLRDASKSDGAAE